MKRCQKIGQNKFRTLDGFSWENLDLVFYYIIGNTKNDGAVVSVWV